MRSYKLALAAGVAASFLIISSGAVNVQADNQACPQSGTCQTQNPISQGNGNRQGNAGRGAGPQAGHWGASLPPKTPGDVPAAVVAAMQAGIADEQHAYAVYSAVIEQWGNVRPFTNIRKAETQHIAAWEFLFDRYDIPVPTSAEFTSPQFASLSDACQAAAEAEIANRDLYGNMLGAFAGYPDLAQAAMQLRTASDSNHLPAFERCAN